MKKTDIEKSLKRFLKRKVSYSLPLLISFMITGGISLGAEITAEEIQETKGDLLTRIQTEREEIRRKIEENERLIKEYNSNFVELVRKGDFYSKPLMPSTQVFFSYQHLDSGKMKDVTDKEFSETIDAINKHYGTRSGRSILKSTGNIGKDKLMAGNGVAVDTQIFRETIEVGANIKPVEPELPEINPNVSVDVSAPEVVLGDLPGLIIIDPPEGKKVEVGVIKVPSTPGIISIPITITENNQITITKPNIEAPNLSAPTVNVSPVTINISLNVKTPDSITSPAPEEPDRVLNIVEPDASPFSDFAWAWMSGDVPKANTDSSSSSDKSLGDNINVTGGTFWSGTRTDGTIANTAGYTGAAQAPYRGQTASGFDGVRNYDKRHLSIINSYNGRWTGLPGNRITGGTFYVAGNVNGISDGATATGTEAFHLVADVHLENVTANLYGKAAFINAEAFRGGQTTMTNVTVNVLRDENTVFHLKGSGPAQENSGFKGEQFATKFAGNANITIDTKKNSVYAVRNFAGGLKIENTGKIIFNGASNIGVSFLTWVPDKSKYIGKLGAGVVTPGETYVPYVKLASSAPMEMYGDENVGIFFNKKISGYDVGIHQGYFDLYFNIGTKLSSSGGVIQTTGGQLGKDGYTAATVDGNVGVYAISGQRNGVDVAQLSNISYFAYDQIHNLIMDKFDIKFGKYSKNGFMFLAKNGTVIDIQGIKTTSFSDGINGTSTSEADTGMGTIIAFAEGRWTAAGTSLTGAALEGKPTEIIVDKNLNMMSKEGIAFLAKDGGLITAKKAAEGYGYGSIIGYADNGTVNINAGIKAIDKGVATEDKKYNNIGGYAIANGTITVTGNAEINGLGAFANGANAKVYLRGTGNKIKTGVSGGLASLKGGYVEFGGGTIEHKDIKAGDHNQKLPFFADNTSKINFTGATTITMYNGAVFSGEASDYAGTAGTSAKYNGMGNVTISLQNNGINLGVFKNQNITWNGETGYLGYLAGIPKVAAIQENGHWYNSYLEGGTMVINKNVDLDAKSDGNTKGGDAFNDIGMEREKITINSGIKITSTDGNGLVLGSNVTANTSGKNADSGYTNNGEIKISGGNQAGVYVSYGHIKNNGLIETDGGSGAVGVNGSKIENTSTGKINIGTVATANGVGIVGLATKIKADGTPDTPESYGTDGGDTTTKVLEISNKGDIVINGTSGVGIYAENNGVSAGKERASVENIGNITVGNSGTSAAVGIYGSKTTISNTGKITAGNGGVAIYATDNSEITTLGTLTLGADGIGVMADGTSNITATSVILAAGSGTDVNGKTGIFYKGTGSETRNINIAIDASAFDKGTAVFVENMNLSSGGQIDVGKEGVGIFVKGDSTNKGTNAGTINLVLGKTGAVGMYTKTAGITNTGTIEVRDSSQIGMYADGANSKVENKGTINLKVDGSTGIYVKDDATAEIAGNGMIFGGNSSLGVYADKAAVNFTDNVNFTSDNADKNIYVYGKDSTIEITSGKTVTVDGKTTGAPGDKTVGIYLEKTNDGIGSTFTSNTTGQLNVVNEAIGIYSNGNNTLKDINVAAAGDKTTGVYIDGKSTISGIVTAKGTDSAGAVGVYGSGGAVTIGTGGLSLNTDTGKGIGMYLTNGAYATGESITINNTVSDANNIGVYYSKGTATEIGDVTNSSAISLSGSKSIGIYTGEGINLINNADITSTAGESENIGSYVGGNSTLTSNGNITMNDNDSIGMYVEEGKGVNSGTITMGGTASVDDKTVVGMVAKADIGKMATIENATSKEIKVGANLGMYIAGTGISSGKNAGTITATTGTGVYVEGTANSFDGTGGTITSGGVGISLNGTDAGQIKTGNLDIKSDGVGVYGNNAKIDFEVNVTGEGAIGVAAGENSAISKNIKTGSGSIGVYLLDDTVTFDNVNIETENNKEPSSPGGNDGKTSVGILLNAVGAYALDKVNVDAKNGVGIYLEDSTKSGSGVKTLIHSGNIAIKNGVGIYVKKGNVLTTGATVLNIDGGTGIYLDGGTANLGTTEKKLTFNFLNGGIGVFNSGGTLILGNNFIVEGSGTLIATSNGDLISSGNLDVGEKATGLLGTYDSRTTTEKSIKNDGGTLIVHNGGIGIAAVKDTTDTSIPSEPLATVTITNTGIINVSGESSSTPTALPTPSIGIYTDVADIVNTGNINVGDKGIGIYSNYNAVSTSIKNNSMTITGTGGIGVYLKGSTHNLSMNNITSTTTGNTGLVLEGVTLNINAGTITLGNESVGVMAIGSTSSTIDGTIKVGDSGTGKSAIGVAAKDSNITLAGTAVITAGAKGIGVYAEGNGTTVTVDDTENITVGTNGIYMYSKGAALNFTGNITADDQIGIAAEGGSVTANGGSTIIVKNGGIGVYVKNTAPTFTTTAIIVQNGVAETSSNSAKYSIGVYYDEVASVGILPTITQTGNCTIGTVLNKSTGNIASVISIGGSGTASQVGIMAKGNSDLTMGGVSVIGGDNNIGIYGEESTIKVTGNISVDAPSSSNADDPMKYSSIGVFLTKGTYTGTTGNLSVGSNSIGIYGKNMTGNISQSGTNMNVGDNGVGIYGSGTGNINLNMVTGIILGSNNSIGVYAKGMNAEVTGNMTVGANTSIGIVSEETGNVTHTGAMNIADKGTNEGDTGSVGIYKLNGTGTITTTAGNNWTVGNNGYGIYVQQVVITKDAAGNIISEEVTNNRATINNGANMNLGTAAVGIYSNGKNIVTNTGDITVGKTNVNGNHDDATKHENSVGIYIGEGTVATSSGTITVYHDHSVGVYGTGTGTKFTNNGIIDIDKGGVGILVRDGAIAVNAAGASINLGGTLADCGATTVGMAAYNGARIENYGDITVNAGVGMLVGNGATFFNGGTITVNNGVGIEGIGSTVNAGHIIINGGIGTQLAGLANAQMGSVEITSDGSIKINGNYVSAGGTLTTDGNLIINGAYVDVTTGVPLFNVHSVSGEVNILPNFASTGNGITYEIKDFVNTATGVITGTKLTPVTSPLFIAKMTDNGDLIIVKRPYADITIGEQFDALDKGLDNILANSNGIGRDAEILKNLNAYLNEFGGDQFGEEASRKLAETRGDIYSTIQGRIQDINRAFDNSFYELESSYNLTKDSSKYSVIYTDGDYKDPTLGIEDYDYKIMGVLYMKEKEGTEYGSKYGYTLGFTGSKFDFENNSKENVYSLRAGIHRVKNLSDEHKVSWLSRIELGYNRHIAKRKLNLHEVFENKGEYNTYSVALDNRLTKVIYTDLSRQLDIYTDLDLEYGKVDSFTESAGSKGGLEVQIKDNDYLSAQLGAGVKASQRIYAVNDVSVKVTADVKYAYELGDNYDGNKARLKNGGEGYYSLITPDEREGKLTGKVGLTVEKANHMGVTFEVEAADEGSRKDSSVKYGVRFNYKF